MVTCRSTVTTGETFEFTVEEGQPDSLSVRDADGGGLEGAVTLLGARIVALAPHPDGVLVLGDGAVGKVARTPAGEWTYDAASAGDVERATVPLDERWQRAVAPDGGR